MTISSFGQNLAMDGHIKAYSGATTATQTSRPIKMADVPMAEPAQVVDNITDNIAQVKKDVQQIQELSDAVMGRKVKFNVNQELNQVVVSIIDPSTDRVIREIPSADIQKLKVRIRKAIGLLFDEMI